MSRPLPARLLAVHLANKSLAHHLPKNMRSPVALDGVLDGGRATGRRPEAEPPANLSPGWPAWHASGRLSKHRPRLNILSPTGAMCDADHNLRFRLVTICTSLFMPLDYRLCIRAEDTLMKNLKLAFSNSRIVRSRSLFSTHWGHRLFAVLFLIFITAITVASTTGGNHLSSGGNVMLAPGKPGLEPALY